MAIEKYGFFDSTSENVREYTEADWVRFSRLAARDGVRTQDDLAVTPGEMGLSVNVGYGLAMVYGHQYELYDDGGVKTLSLDAPEAAARTDRIVIRLRGDDDTIKVQVLKGTEGAGAPALSSTTSAYDISLAQVTVGVGATSISEEDIIDDRSDSSVCGILQGLTPYELRTLIAIVNMNAEGGINSAINTANEAKAQADYLGGAINNTIPKVGGATQGHIPTFNASGALSDSGVSMAGFTRARMTLSGTTLTITTVS